MSAAAESSAATELLQRDQADGETGAHQTERLRGLPPGSWRTPLCGPLGRGGLVVDRGLHATGAVASSTIIEVDDPCDNSLLRFLTGPEMMTGEHLVFQGGEE